MRWLALALLLASCTAPPPQPELTAPAATPTPKPVAPLDVAAEYLRQWQDSQFGRMYELLSAGARATTPQDVFVRRHVNIRNGIGEVRLDAQIGDGATTSGEGEAAVVEVPFEVRRSLAILGDIGESNVLRLVFEGDAWKIDWHAGVIFNGLTANTSVRFTPDPPRRGRILDRSGEPLADNGSILAVGVVPGEIKDEAALLSALSESLDMSAETIKKRYQGGQPNWFMPIATRPAADRPDFEARLGSVAGVSLQDRPARVYPLGAAAAHVVGYVAHPSAEDLQKRGSEGLGEADWIGRAGLEASFEDSLVGTNGGVIQVVDSAGRVLRTIAQKAAIGGQDVRVNLDAAIQRKAFEALGDHSGSVVAIDPRDNALRALASAPSFDPNRFVIGLSDAEWQELNGPARPMVLRAAGSAYPTGSIFKVITMAAGLERGGVTLNQTFDCGLEWHGLPGVTLRNWESQGRLMLTQALTQSCNPAFYEIGLALDRIDPVILPSYARAFGLGQPTRVVGIHEASGSVPDPTRQAWSAGDAVNLAIGQGYLLATPLQMANAYAALARGDKLVAPALIPEGNHQLGELGISSATRAAILDGMKRVTSTARGTAAYAFQGERLQIAAKTGSAENEGPDAHAWFVGFTPPDDARLLVLVMVEGGQQGSTVAAPIARQVIDFAYPLL